MAPERVPYYSSIPLELSQISLQSRLRNANTQEISRPTQPKNAHYPQKEKRATLSNCVTVMSQWYYSTFTKSSRTVETKCFLTHLSTFYLKMASRPLEIEEVEPSEEGKVEKDEKVVCIGAKCRGPGPAKYLLPGTIGLKGHDIRKKRCPAFSFGQRHKEFSSSFSPGPKYMIPAYATRKGKETAPAFSLYSRTRDNANFHTPGPGILVLSLATSDKI